MASPGPGGPPEPKTNNRHYRKNSRSKASKVMMDQAEFRGYAARFRRSCRCTGESARAIAESAARQGPPSRPSPPDLGRRARPGTRPQARRPERTDHPPHQARQELFIRSRQRHGDPPCRHHPPPELDGGAAGLWRSALFARSELASAGRRPRCRGPAAIPLPRRLGEGARAAQGPPAGAAGRGARQKSAATSRCICRATSRRANSRSRR